VDAHGYADPQIPILRDLLTEHPALAGVAGPRYAWAYTPLALPLIDAVAPDRVIYDCMDALTHFRNAPPELAAREDALMARADLVFCGGVSLYRARAGRHRNIHCFPSSVDPEHFAPRALPTGEDPQSHLPRPRIGYCGVIDERIDLALVGEAARARPHWQFSLVGPVVKIDPDDVPALPNVHRFGQQPYEALPRFMAGWDVAMMPFALNESTRYISPTKTLEYLAAGKPVVSTPIADVVASYQGVVDIVQTPEDFIAACGKLLDEDREARALRAAAMRRCVAATSWDKTAAGMADLIEALDGRRIPRRAAAV
jgi:glycosyltransferase involved in cell wall biosynthesis